MKETFRARLLVFFNNNAGSVLNPFMLWNAHKAFMRGIGIQMGMRAMRQRQKRLTDLIKEILIIDTQNKLNTSRTLSQKLLQLRYDLRLLLLENFEKSSRKLKMTYYANGNTAGKLLAQNLKGHRYKTKIPIFIHSGTKQKEYHPQKITDAFKFYRVLYIT